MQHCRRFAWRRLRVINRCSAARRPQYEIVSMVTQYEEDVSHAAVVVDEDKIPVRVYSQHQVVSVRQVVGSVKGPDIEMMDNLIL